MADVIVVNTCAFISSAQEKRLYNLQLAEYKSRADADIDSHRLFPTTAQDIRAHIPEVDAVLGTGALNHLATVLKQLDHKSETIVCVT